MNNRILPPHTHKELYRSCPKKNKKCSLDGKPKAPRSSKQKKELRLMLSSTTHLLTKVENINMFREGLQTVLNRYQEKILKTPIMDLDNAEYKPITCNMEFKKWTGMAKTGRSICFQQQDYRWNHFPAKIHTQSYTS